MLTALPVLDLSDLDAICQLIQDVRSNSRQHWPPPWRSLTRRDRTWPLRGPSMLRW
ncbi:hypothetical protein ACU4GD_28930 [Cupriavidus basilensis]